MIRITDEHGKDITELAAALLREGIYEREFEAEEAQEAVAAHLHRHPRVEKDGWRPLMAVTPRVYWHWTRREGRECWGDEGFRKDLLRDNPCLRMPLVKPTNRVSLTGAGLEKVQDMGSGLLDAYGRPVQEGVPS